MPRRRKKVKKGARVMRVVYEEKPRKCLIGDPIDAQRKINRYFELCEEKGRPFTLTGLALYLKTTKPTLYNYSLKEEYKEMLAQAKQRIENFIEEESLLGHINPIIAKFNLQNNFGWKDKREDIVTNINENSYKELTTEELKKLVGGKNDT